MFSGCHHPAHRSPRQQEQSPPGRVIPCPNPTHIHEPLSSLPAPLQAAIGMLSWDREVLPAPLNPAEAQGAPNLSLLYRGFTSFGAAQPHGFFSPLEDRISLNAPERAALCLQPRAPR